MVRRSKRTLRQLALNERGQQVPSWTTLPDECRRAVVALLARLMQSESVANEEESNDE